MTTAYSLAVPSGADLGGAVACGGAAFGTACAALTDWVRGGGGRLGPELLREMGCDLGA